MIERVDEPHGAQGQRRRIGYARTDRLGGREEATTVVDEATPQAWHGQRLAFEALTGRFPLDGDPPAADAGGSPGRTAG